MSRDLNKAFVLKKEQRNPRWIVIDARGQRLGRLATQIADTLRGKNLPIYTPHTDSGHYVVVINSQDVVLTGNKWNEEKYDRYSGWMGGYKIETAKEVHRKDPTRLITLAVKRMLPKSKLSDAVISKLKVYAAGEHPHQAQVR